MSGDTLEMPPVDWLEPFLLLGLRERGCYGQELTQKMAGFGFGTTRPGAMYRALRQMQKEGMVVSERDGFDSRLSRRRYSITGSGEDYLTSWANSLAQYQEEVNLFFRTHAEMPARDGRG